MKLTIHFSILMLLLAGTTASADKYEPDSDILNAQVIATDGSIQVHSIFPEGDEDWVTFDVSATTYVNINLTGEFTPYGARVWLYDEESVQVDMYRRSGKMYKLDMGRYYIKVDHEDDEVIPEYLLSVHAFHDSYEYDDMSSYASSITTNGQKQVHSISLEDDVDWVKFTLGGDNVVVVESHVFSSNGSVTFELYDKDKNLLSDNANFSRPRSRDVYLRNSSRIVEALEAGEYYVKVQGYFTTQYTLSVEVIPDDIYEPDDVYTESNIVKADGSEWIHNLSSTNDTDWVKFSLENSHNTVIRFHGKSALDYVDLFLYKKTGGNFEQLQNQQGNILLISQILEAGEYYLKMQSEDVISQYTLSIEAVLDDSFEPDDTYAQASDIEIGGAEQFHNLQSGDSEDWIRFSLDNPDTVIIMAQGSSEQNLQMIPGSSRRTNSDQDKIKIALYKKTDDKIDKLDDSSGDISWIGKQLEAGEYYVQVKPYRSYNTDVTYYTLSIKDLPDDAYEPNGQLDAKDIMIDSSEQVHKFSQEDTEDWVKFTLSSRTIVAIESSVTDLVPSYMTLELYDQNFNSLSKVQGQEYPLRIVQVLDASDYNYYIKIKRSMYDFPYIEYTLSVTDTETVRNSNVKLRVDTTEGGQVIEPGIGLFVYDLNEMEYNITATANSGYHFAGWTGTAVEQGKIADPYHAETTVSFHANETLQGEYTLIANFMRALIVDANTISDYENGSSMYPFNTIQEAIDAATSGETIMVRPGIYVENLVIRNPDITITSNSVIPNAPNPLGRIGDTIIIGDHFGPVVLFEEGAGANCVLDGFTITDGKAISGAGISCIYSSPLIKHCIIAGNYADRYGGGGVDCFESRARFEFCTFVGNYASQSGGAILCTNSDIELVNCIFWANQPNAIASADQAHVLLHYSCLQEDYPGEGNINEDPLFADTGFWADINNADLSLSPEDPHAIWYLGDYHLKSQAGRWNPVSKNWIIDETTSPCVDTGEPEVPWIVEPEPNGDRVNMGVYGNTWEASLSSSVN